MENKIELDINVILEMYKQKLSISEHENILLQAQNMNLQLQIEEMRKEKLVK